MVQRFPGGYVFDPADPRAPSEEQWAQMTPEERDRVVEMLPGEDEVTSELARRAAELEKQLAERDQQLAEALAEVARLKRERL